MRGSARYSPEEPTRPYGGRSGAGSYRSVRMRTDWGIYEDPGHLRGGGIYSVSDVAGVGVYHDGADDDDLVDDHRGDEKVYGFSPPTGSRLSSTGKWSSTHSLAPASSPGRSVHSISGGASGGHRASLGESHRPTHANSYVRDSLKRHDYSRQHHQSRSTNAVEALYRSVDKRSGDRVANGGSSTSGSRSQQPQQGRSYSAGSRSEYSTPAAGYRSLRSYPTTADDYDDREPRSLDNSALSDGYNARATEYASSRAHNSIKRSNNKEYFTPSEIYSNRRSYPSDTHPTRTSVTKGILTNSNKYSGGSRSSISIYNTESRNNLSGYSVHNDEGKNNLSVPDTYEKRGISSYSSRQSVNTSTKGSQTEVSISSDLQYASEGRTGSRSNTLQVPEGISSGSSRRSSSSTQQVTFRTVASGGGSDSSQQNGKEDRYDTLGRREAGTLRKDRKKNTKDEQNQTEDDMSQWGGRNGGGSAQWVGQGHDHGDPGYAHESALHPQHNHSRALPLPRPPLPPQHYPGHDSQPQGGHHPSPPPDHAHYTQQQHNHAYHNHGHNHVHHTQHSRHQSAGSGQPLVKADSADGRKCRDCMTRVPYATLIATVMCCVGVGVFCGTMYRGTTLTLRLFEDVFKLHIKWVEPVQLTFMVVGAGMGGLGLMILFVGCLSTGDTRNKVYRTWRGRVGGRISCAIFMGITYLLSLAWLLMFAALIIVTLFYTLAWFQCLYILPNECIDYNQFSFLFPEGTPEEDKRVCTGERKLFCKDYVNNAEIMFILASVSAFLVILSLVHYLMCLAANYAHIKDQEKFMDLQEIQFLHESEMSTLPKDRF
ncbi:RNA-binding motif protein, X-linked-like-3 isoform X2 [Homarus americanus]|nr:RNA-binding motif protein, X-linked-like-3 isoform X2 [Homarus americanus]